MKEEEGDAIVKYFRDRVYERDGLPSVTTSDTT